MQEIFIVFLVSLVILALTVWLYFKLTCGMYRGSKHLVGKTVIITGGNSGIGFETAKNLADRGARVILACRNGELGIAARKKIIKATGNPDVHYRHLDLASLKSVRAFADNIINTEKRIDIHINNAGLCASNFEKTEDGLLLEMQINHFGPFLSTNLLLPLLKSSAPSRIINVASTAYIIGDIDFDNLNAEKETEKSYGKIRIYCNTKLCNILMAVELDRWLKVTGVTVNSLHPGAVITNFGSKSRTLTSLIFILKPFFKTALEGAQTTIQLAVAPELSTTSGRYFRDCKEVTPFKKARDTELARRLWKESVKLVKLRDA